MEYIDLKLEQRFGPGTRTQSARHEEEAFYQSFGARTALVASLWNRLTFRPAARRTRTKPPLLPQLRKTTV